ncbi:MAG: hypothetical protein U0174_04890 [Polyangiaceae bacterium]
MKHRAVFVALYVAASGVCGGCGGCRRSQNSPSGSSGGEAPVIVEGPRCSLLPNAVTLPDGVLDIGAVHVKGGRIVFGATMQPASPTGAPNDAGFNTGPSTKQAVVLSIDLASGGVTTTTLGRQLADDPMPYATFSVGSDATLATFVRFEGDEKTTRVEAARALVAGTVAGGVFTEVGKGKRGLGPVVSFTVGDRAGVFLSAMTGEAGHENRLVVSDVRSGAVVSTVTTEGAYAEDLALVPTAEGTGFAMAWAALKPQYDDAGDRPEGPGVDRAERWVEGVKLDDKGACVKAPCAPVRLSKGSAHVGYFQLVNEGVTTLFFRDDEERHVGRGSEIYSRRWGGPTPEAVMSVRSEGVGARAFDVLKPTWVAYTNVSEELQVAVTTAAGGEFASLDAGGVDLHDGLLTADVRVLDVTHRAGTKDPPSGPLPVRLVVLRGRLVQQLDCTARP